MDYFISKYRVSISINSKVEHRAHLCLWACFLQGRNLQRFKAGSRTVKFFRFWIGLGSTAVLNFGSVPVKVQIN